MQESQEEDTAVKAAKQAGRQDRAGVEGAGAGRGPAAGAGRHGLGLGRSGRLFGGGRRHHPRRGRRNARSLCRLAGHLGAAPAHAQSPARAHAGGDGPTLEAGVRVGHARAVRTEATRLSRATGGRLLRLASHRRHRGLYRAARAIRSGASRSGPRRCRCGCCSSTTRTWISAIYVPARRFRCRRWRMSPACEPCTLASKCGMPIICAMRHQLLIASWTAAAAAVGRGMARMADEHRRAASPPRRRCRQRAPAWRRPGSLRRRRSGLHGAAAGRRRGRGAQVRAPSVSDAPWRGASAATVSRSD